MAKSLGGKRWIFAEPDPVSVSRLTSELGIGPILARLLALRGLGDPEAADRFLHPNLKDLIEPSAFVEMPKAVERLIKASEKGERVLIHGDYDVDGIVSSALVVEYLRLRGIDADVVLPNRFEEGYGLSPEKVREAAAKGYTLLLTVDCGITASEEIALANSLGVEVIVTDHHQPSQGRPDGAVAVIDPKLSDSGYPFDTLSGTGVAFKLLEALEIEFRERGAEEIDPTQWHDLVALGTIADVVPLLNENRVLVRSGLERLRVTKRPGLRALIEKAGLIQEKIAVWSIAFGLAPRLNAAGRLGDPVMALDLLLSHDFQDAMELAGILEETNRQRKVLEDGVRKDCDRMIAQDPKLAEAEFLLLAKPNWPKGVLGIVASRMVETYYRPTVLLTIEGDEAHGSGRSIPGFNLVDCLARAEELLFSYGGHEGAAGLRLSADKIPALRETLVTVAKERLKPADLVATLHLDGELALEDLDEKLMAELEWLEPHGEGNRTPTFATYGVDVTGRAQVFGNNHLKFILGTPSRPIEALAFSQGHLFEKVSSARMDFAYTLRRNSYRGQDRIEMQLKDMRLSDSHNGGKEPTVSTKTERRVIDWRGRSERLQSIRKEIENRSERVVFAIDADDPLKPALLELSRGAFGCDTVEDFACFAEACHAVHEGSRRAVFSPVWRNEGALLDQPTLPLRVFLLSFPTGDFAETPRLLEGLLEHRESLWLYLAFGQEEYRKKRAQISESYPDDNMLRVAYKHLRSLALDNRARLADALELWNQQELSSLTLRASIAVLEEIDLASYVDGDTMVELLPWEKKRSLEESPTYKHGQIQRQSFEQWGRWVLKAPAPDVARKI